MATMIKKLLPGFVIFLLPFSAFSQKKDFGIWYSLNIKENISEKLNADFSAELRTFKDAGKIEQYFLEAGIEYKITTFLSAQASYRLTDAYEKDTEYHLQHKIFTGLVAKAKISRLTLQGRIRFQTRFRTYIEDPEDNYPDYTARFRIKATYRTPSFPANPFLYAESFVPLNKEPEKFIGKNRFSSGIEYSISKKHSIEAAYIFQRDYLPKLSDEHIINISYNLSF
ncbi:MAG TPA: DUF2490 domain-containing protein [Bacteroidales bacterium]|nr:DUF2490 domain-containing protein [Bacteroidales bacterium]